MNHAEVHARLMDLALEPARLRGLDQDIGPAASELRAHLDTCADCRAELHAWRATVAALDIAVGDAGMDGEAPVRSLEALGASAGVVTLPAGLRARTLAAAQEPKTSPIVRPAATRRGIRPLAWLALAAALVVFFFGAFAIVDRARQLDQARADTAALDTVAATLNGILQDPGHRVALLSTPAGNPAGSVSWSPSEGTVVVLAGELQTPPQGQVYRCWIEQDGARVAVGEMRLSGSIAYWAGGLDSWGATFAPGGRFSVSLESIGGGSSGTVVLVGTI